MPVVDVECDTFAVIFSVLGSVREVDKNESTGLHVL
jgi:hypothetical protein